MRPRTVALCLLTGLGLLAGCGGSSHHAPKIVAAKAERPFASDQSALSAKAVLDGHAVSTRTTGRIVASNGFEPGRDGFSFENYGFIAGSELDQHAMIELFGAGVCSDAPTDSCTLTPAAQQWAVQYSDLMINGHCYGFSVTTLRFFKHLLNPSQFGGASTFSLSLSPSLQSEIAYGMVLQVLPPVQRATILTTPTDAVKLLERALANPSGEAYSLGIQKADGSDGHEITPIAIEDLGGGRFDVEVYDNNYPNTTRALEVDTNGDTWTYQGSPNPSDQAGIYNGQHNTNPMQLAPLSSGLARQPCPFCVNASGGASAAGPGRVDVSLAGNPIAHGHLLITTAEGKRIGYVHGRFVNDIRGAHAYQPALNRTWKARPEPLYELPAGGPLKVTLDGAGATGADSATIHVTGPGFGATVANLKPRSGASDTLTITPGGGTMKLAASGTPTGAVPTIQLAIDHGQGGSELIATPRTLAAGGALRVGLDPGARRVSVAKSGSGPRTPMTLSLQQVGPRGSTTTSNAGVPLTPGHRTVLSLGLSRIR